ncbi:MAG: TonB-dependent receptor domain-containing protein [Bacteroidota bacterium]|jgi:TonB-dependent receptor
MRKLFLFTFLIFGSFLFSQKVKVYGKIKSASGEGVPYIYVVPSPGGNAEVSVSDFEGAYELNLNPGNYSISFKGTGFKPYDEKNYHVKGGASQELNITLQEAGLKFDTVVVRGKAIDGSFAKTTEEQKTNAASSEVVGKQMIESRPTTNTSDVIKIASGASIQDNRFAIIRGLNDRYNGAFLNGAPLPSTESDRKAFSFDIFPSNMLDNLSINKTATPDMPAEFGGGLIFITTKNIPEKDFMSASISGGYNTVATGKERIYYKGGSLDWLGIDDGTRSLPSAIPSQKDYPVNIAQQAEMAKKLNNNWALLNGAFAPNMNMQFSFGKNFKKKVMLDGKEEKKDVFGMLVALTYTRNYNLLQTTRRSYTNNTDPSVPSQMDNEYFDKSYISQTLAGAIANFAWKINETNNISLKNILSVNTDDRVITRNGTTNPLESNPTLIRSSARWFTGNKIYSSQLHGEHLIETQKIKINWIASYSAIERVIPDLRRSVYSRFQSVNDPTDPNPLDTVYIANISVSTVSPDNGGGIFNAKTNESIVNGRADFSKSFAWGEIKSDSVLGGSKKFKNSVEVKGGVYYQLRDRSFDARQMGLTQYKVAGGTPIFNDNLLYLSEDQIFAPENMGLMSNGYGGFKLVDATKPTDSYIAQSSLGAGYLMFDYRFTNFLRVVSGVRYESFRQVLNSRFDNGNPLNIDNTVGDFLPSINGILTFSEKHNLRMSYSQTVNRPEFRELAPFAFYDFNTQFLYSGNENLKRALIHNYDLRYEFYPGRGQIITATVFNKDFINPIEQVSRQDVSGEIFYANVPKARNMGFETEFRYVLGALFKADSSKFLNALTFYTNFAYISSKVTLTNNANAGLKSRQLQGQSPYVFNAGFIYNDTKKGNSFSISANRVGQRIAIVGNINEPDIWENGRTVIDLQIGKTIKFFTSPAEATGKRMKSKLEIRLNLRDGLAQNLYFFQDRNGNKKLDLDKDDIIWNTKLGRVISISAGYTF